MSKLKSMKEYQEEKRKLHEILNGYPKPTGVQCPECDGELEQVDSTYTATPIPMMNVKCTKCSYRGKL